VSPPRSAAVAAALCAVATSGCGLGPGEDEGEVELTVSRDFGTRVSVDEEAEIDESDTVIRVLDRETEISTRFDGGFVHSIDGLAGSVDAGRRSDWFFYVNGVESGRGSAEFDVGDGDRVWWDHHDWSTAMRAPAVVGDWPEPFVHGYDGDRWTAGVYCGGARALCAQIHEQLGAEGARTDADPAADQAGSAEEGESGDDGEIRVLVGPWDALRADPVAGLLRFGPDRSGVFATFSGTGEDSGLTLLSPRGRVVESFGEGAGLVAALRPDESPPTWVVTGTDAAGVAAAAALVGDELSDRFAVAAAPGGEPIGVPVP
jgi:hypothetical protein